MKPSSLITAWSVTLAALAGCASPPSAADRLLAMQLLSERVRLPENAQAAGEHYLPVAGRKQAEREQHAPATPQKSEAEVGRLVSGWPRARSEADLETKREGFSIGGRRIVDSEGRITGMALDRNTGNLTYIAEIGPERYQIKAMNLARPERVTLATGTRSGSTYYWTTTSGVRVNGDRVTPTGQGFLVGRDNVIFRYVPGIGLSDMAAPEDFTLAVFQNGAVGTTGWVLLERTTQSREDAERSSGYGIASLGKVIEAGKRIGSLVGMGTGRRDYALFDSVSGKSFPLEIGMDQKQVTVMSQCFKKNAWINDCRKAESFESLYDPDGFTKKYGHYYWRIRWFDTKEGPVAVLQEGSLSSLDVLNLNTGARSQIVHFPMGIRSWDAVQDSTGSIDVNANYALTSTQKTAVEQLVPGFTKKAMQ